MSGGSDSSFALAERTTCITRKPFSEKGEGFLEPFGTSYRGKALTRNPYTKGRKESVLVQSRAGEGNLHR